MKTSEILRRAAELVASDNVYCRVDCGWSCCALSAVAGENRAYFVAKKYLVLFLDAPWWCRDRTPENQDDRRDALLMASAIAESEGN